MVCCPSILLTFPSGSCPIDSKSGTTGVTAALPGISREDHAAVTAGVYYRQMLSAGRRGEAGVTGVLILRIWVEGSSDDPQLRIRLVGRQDLARNAQDTASASTIEE